MVILLFFYVFWLFGLRCIRVMIDELLYRLDDGY